MTKIGLVLEGGGLRGAYTAGCLAWLNDHHIEFDYGVGISSGALALCCFGMEEKEIPYKMFVHYASSPECVGLTALTKEGHYVAYRYIFEHYLKELGGMKIEPLKKKNPNYEIGIYNLDHGQTEFFKVGDIDDEMELLLGACALPVASEVIEYQDMHLLDGGITKMIPIERAIDEGCDKFLTITTKPADYVRKPASFAVKVMMKFLYPKWPQVVKDYSVRHLNYYHQIDLVKKTVNDGTGMLINPSKTINVSRFKGDVDHLQELYELGYADMEEKKNEILQFLEINQ